MIISAMNVDTKDTGMKSKYTFSYYTVNSSKNHAAFAILKLIIANKSTLFYTKVTFYSYHLKA